MEMIWPGDFINKILCGDSLSILKTMPAESINMCLTSPPYWGLRDYGIEQIFGGRSNCKHEWVTHIQKPKGGQAGKKAKVNANKNDFANMRDHNVASNTGLKCGAWKGQLGLEPGPELYIEHMTEIFHEIKRVLRKDGTLWLNLGDTYSTHTSKRSGQFGKDIKDGFDNIYSRKRILPLQEKCLCMIPERLAWSLIQDGWILRNKIIWRKPNPMPSSVKDRFSNTWEYLYMFSKSRKYYFDLDAVREPHIIDENRPMAIIRNREFGYESKENLMRGRKWSRVPGQQKQTIEKHSGYYDKNGNCLVDFEKGKNPGDVIETPGDFWSINTQPFPEAHFAVFPEKLCERPIKAGCPEEICKKCGKARERIVEKYDTGRTQKVPDYWDTDPGSHLSIHRKGRNRGKIGIPVLENRTIGRTDCGCNAGFEPGILIDPFCGAGTALYVAKEMRRRFIGIDIKQEYVEMTEKRLAQGVL